MPEFYAILLLAVFIYSSFAFLRNEDENQDSTKDTTRYNNFDICDQSTELVPNEGNIGRLEMFPWVGVLRIHFHTKQGFKMVGMYVVLVKERFAVVHADEINKVPNKNLKKDSKVMFQKGIEIWQTDVKGFISHPEYYMDRLNTIALIEIELSRDFEDMYHPKPICWPTANTNYINNRTYLMGFTDENMLIEKVIFKTKFVDVALCDDFYNRGGLYTNQIPKHYGCGLVKSNKDFCAVENGVPIISQATGTWTLIGITVAGTTCNGPTRIIKIQPYMSWIDRNTHQEQDDDGELIYK